MKLSIAIAGTRGIPNEYGGFEQFATYLSEYLVKRGHTVTVYNSHKHGYQEHLWRGVTIVHCYDPEYMVGTFGQFIYDFNCIRDARSKNFDIVLFLGYTSNAIWGFYYPFGAKIITNMDGMEWKRSKYHALVRYFLKWSEKMAVKYSHQLVADSIPVMNYLERKYKRNATFISYGATVPENNVHSDLTKYGVKEKNYFLLIARMEPENNIDTVLEGYTKSGASEKMLVIGHTGNAFGKKMLKKYGKRTTILFPGAIYDKEELDELRKHCIAYFHGHSVGGTNPSLLEAMAAGSQIMAHENEFNRAVLGNRAYYFSNAEDIAILLSQKIPDDKHEKDIQQNRDLIEKNHQWNTIVDQYEHLFYNTVQKSK
ncbi:MAG: hypothetical protein RLZZ28_1835 [Bacteroidota bacterium]